MVGSTAPSAIDSLVTPAARRLNALAPLDAEGLTALHDAGVHARALPLHKSLLVEGQAINEASLFLDGWAARVRDLPDGRRALMNFLLPGDLIGLCDHEDPVASSTVVALTRVTICPAPPSGVSAPLDRAYAISRATEEAHLLAQITRLSRLNASDRLSDLLLELLERLELAGLAANGRYEFPLTQETLGDALGLSTVHVNRTLQQARRSGEITLGNGRVRIADPEALRTAIGRQPVRVSGGQR